MSFDNALSVWGDRWSKEIALRLGVSSGSKAKNNRCIPMPNKSKSTLNFKNKVIGIIKKKPETMVKIAKNGWKKNAGHVGAHLDYITRNGVLELETSDGETIKGKDNVKEWLDNLELSHSENPKNREGVSIILSMPSGTNAEGLNKAVKEFCEEEFTDRKWAFVLHSEFNDGKTKQPHCHLFLKSKDLLNEKKNLRINKSKLQQYREQFAVYLEKNGIRANATPRDFRGVSKRYSDLRRKPSILPKNLTRKQEGVAVEFGKNRTLRVLSAITITLHNIQNRVFA